MPPRRTPPKPIGCTPREELFAEGLYAGKTSNEAYLEAGYSDMGYECNASAALRIKLRPHVQDYLALLRAERLKGARLSRQEILDGVTELAIGAKAETTKLSSFRTLMQHEGMLTDRVMHIIDNEMAYIILGDTLGACEVEPDLADRIIKEFSRQITIRGR